MASKLKKETESGARSIQKPRKFTQCKGRRKEKAVTNSHQEDVKAYPEQGRNAYVESSVWPMLPVHGHMSI
jgi:hypothetical protein